MERVGSIKSDNYTRENNFRMYTDLIAHACMLLCCASNSVCVCFLSTYMSTMECMHVNTTKYTELYRKAIAVRRGGASPF